jgi:hypothetical protein
MNGVATAAEWETVPVGRGHDGLRELAADGFSGGVTDGVAWAMLTNGRVVGVVGGTVADLADADLTAHAAPDPALPLLAVMREAGGEPRAQYYTEETPLSEVDATLRGAGFTGYVELSENVLSGDYYVVYYGGDRLPVAFIGGSRRVVSGDEAFDRADGEVGIYGVYDADVSVTDLPEPESAPADEAESAAATPVDLDGVTDDEAVSVGTTAVDDADEDGDPTTPEADPVSVGESDDGTDETVAAVDDGAAGADAAATSPDEDADDSGSASVGVPRDGAEASAGSNGSADADADDRAATVDADGPAVDATDAGDGETRASETDAEEPSGTVDENDGPDARVADLRETVADLRAERDSLQAEVERLREELARVERERDDLRDRTATPEGSTGRAMSATAALSGTNLLVRYGSKAEPTLERALDDGADGEAVNDNLVLEAHTSFEREGATVDGQPFDEFLAATVEFRFVEWLVRALPYELRDAPGNRPLGRLYKTMPSFDRAEVGGSVPAGDDGEERTFDVVVRDRKGAPLAVASVFDGREPATEAMLADLVEDARAVAAANESLGAALFVTTSYYAPDALELAEEATSSGGLFGRGSRESYVRLDRSHGFHLCLVEARDDDFHLGVPDL